MMTFSTLALIALVGLAGPLVAGPVRWRIPVVVGELAAGIVLGRTGIHRLHSGDPTFTFLANVGFALVMFVAGSHVPVRDPRLRSALRIGGLRAVAVAVLAIPLGIGLAAAFGTGHGALYAVLVASSSAAFVLPVVDNLRLDAPAVTSLLPQVALADAACIVALPLAVDPGHAGRAAIGAGAVIAATALAFVVMRAVERSGLGERARTLSKQRKFALELRVSLVLLFALAALATRMHVSIMIAGFGLGVAIAGVGEPRRLAKQLFALTEGFLGPLFFVWLGASLDLRALGSHPSYLVLGMLLGAAGAVAHVAMRLSGQPLRYGLLGAAQLGVPVAAATLGTQLRLLRPGEPAALLLGALVTIALATVAARGAALSRSD
jgi:Kef-type K+ transport system membrane component KefB